MGGVAVALVALVAPTAPAAVVEPVAEPVAQALTSARRYAAPSLVIRVGVERGGEGGSQTAGVKAPLPQGRMAPSNFQVATANLGLGLEPRRGQDFRQGR